MVDHSLIYPRFGDLDADELTPRSGKDDDYDAIVAEIEDLERGLDDELKKFEKKLGYAGLRHPVGNGTLTPP